LKRLNVSGNYSALNDKTGGSAMSLKPLSNLILLQHLEVEGNGVTDISPLSSLVNMEYLNIRSNAITELGGLSQMKMLRELQAGKNKIVDASALGNCTMLEIIGLESNSFYVQDDLGEYSFVGLGDISFAETLVELKNINVSSNLVSSLAPLANAENIVSINAMSNHIADIECLRGSLVSQLLLESNFITTFAAIESMPNLTELGFYGNPIEDAHAVEVFVFKQNYPGATLPPELTENREIAGDI
jgi:Leucine-rich repeat (LRR) protein